MSQLERLTPHHTIPNIGRYYWLMLFSNCWFATATWIFFVQKFMSLVTFGIVDSLIFAFGMLLEIPTGALADMLGKKRAIQLAMFFLACGSLAMGLSQSIPFLIFTMAVVQIGLAFYSGSVEALVYDSLLDNQKQHNYDKVIATGMIIINITSAVATALGGWLFEWQFRSPLIAWSIGNWLGFILSFWLSEPKHSSVQFSMTTYLKQTTDGVRALFTPQLRHIIPFVLTVLSVVYLWEWGMVRTVSATFFGLPITSQSTLYALLPLGTVVIIRYLPFFRQHVSDLFGLQIAAIVIGLAYASFAWVQGWWGIAPLAVIGITGGLVFPWSSVLINQHLSSRHRATALSTLALLTKIPYILISPLIGYLADNQRYHWYGWGVAGVLVLAIMVSKIVVEKRGMYSQPLIA
jgi:MFS family permease